MAKDIVAADYNNVKACLSKMEQEAENIKAAAKSFLQAVENTTDWQGIDAVAYKAVLKSHSAKIQNSANWLNALNNRIDKHAERLYQRALRDEKTSNFFH